MYPDDIMGTEIDDLYERRLQLHQIPNQFDDTIQQSRHNINTTEVNATTEAYPVASISPEIAAIPRNVTLAQIKRRRLKQQLERFLETDLPSVSDYMNNDDPTNLTKQFDKLVAEHRKRTRETRREIYFSHEYSSAKRDEKVRVMAMAEHFVYATRYKLVLYQVMRNKYYGSMKFRLGFLFALLRHLKNLQKWLYWSFLEFRIILLSHELKLLFKVMRLDLDIRYVVRLIQKVDYKKNMLYDPGFYNLPAQKRRK
ncbi:hypothetical protein HW555_010156 [Spodoptera exigua]|uniref:Uncharacterized protein n=1 Tax=Spodoptera exigua TaxID=7107 RepID=A0A835G9N5_SPOEX|nr:hypothetical protein HW555_010156 [Spodoptera exigua]